MPGPRLIIPSAPKSRRRFGGEHGYGFRPNPPEHRVTDFSVLRASLKLGAVAATVSLAGYLPQVLDQGDSSACTGHAKSEALYTTMKRTGSPIFLPSPNDLYRIGRALDRLPNPDGTLPPLTDDGAEPNQVTRGAQSYGIVPFGTHPADAPVPGMPSIAAHINDELDLFTAERASMMLFVGAYEIAVPPQSPAEAVKSMCAALQGGYVFEIGIPVDAAFENYGTVGSTGSVVEAIDDSSTGLLGYHDILVHGYETLSTGEVVFMVRNSWGTQWGANGDGLISSKLAPKMSNVIVEDVKLLASP